MLQVKLYSACLVLLFASIHSVFAENDGWYTEGDLVPTTRIKINLVNTLDFDRTDCPVVITRHQMPVKDLHEMRTIVVDPSLTPNDEPTREMFIKGGAQILRRETNGHQIFHQLDDLDKDGIWDELFFMTDIGAHEIKTMYIYTGFAERGWNEHGTHAGIGSYSHHLVPFWESEHMGWKLWYPADCDLYGKRKGSLVAYEMYTKNIDGYLVPYDHGSDIMTVENTFGAGGICLFEFPSHSDSVSRPRFTPALGEKMTRHNFNMGQITDTRYAFEVVVNGPERSIIRVKTMNWHTGAGSYELEQLYTAYRNQNYSTCKVQYRQFLPEESLTVFGCGIRKNSKEYDYYQDNGIVITIGDEVIENPDDDMGLGTLHVDFVGTALVVKDKYKPKYQFVPSFGGNHTFKIPTREDLSYEYLIAGAWSEGSILNTSDEFKDYIIKTAKEYNNPVEVIIKGIETKQP